MDFCQCVSPNQLKAALKELRAPLRTERPLDGIYNKTMDRISQQPARRAQLALKVLSWLVKAARTLTVDEIRVAVSIPVAEDAPKLQEGDMPDSALLVEVCAGLAIIDENSNTIQLAHYSVQEYLAGNKVIPETRDFEPAIICIAYLSFAEPFQMDVSNKALSTTHPLQDYAISYLEHHLQRCDEHISVDSYLKFLQNREALCCYQGARITLKWRHHPNTPGASPLHEACRSGHYPAVRSILNGGVDISLSDSAGRTALYHAARRGHDAVVRLLLEHGADIPLSASANYTCLGAAAKHGHEAVVRVLLENGADSSASDPRGLTPLHHAAQLGHKTLVVLLLENGADMSVADKAGQGPIYHAARDGKLEIVRLLLENGADVSASDKFGQTPLFGAAFYGHETTVCLLLEQGAGISVRTNDGWTPLHGAAWMGQDAVVRLLLEKGADIPSHNNKGETPLYAGSSMGRIGVVRLLLENGANASDQANDGSTAESVAKTPEIRQVLYKALEGCTAVQVSEIPLSPFVHSQWACCPGSLSSAVINIRV